MKQIEWKAFAAYALVAGLVLAPLFAPGFILTLDMVFTPELPMPTEVSSSYLFHALLHWVNLVIPADVIQKILLLAILLLASIGMHRLVRLVERKQAIDWGVYIASIFYMLNPFIYARFMAGQYAVLLGYALLPWFVRSMVTFGREPNLKNGLKLGALVTLIGIVSIHTLGAVAILAIVGAAIMFRRRQKAHLVFGSLALGFFLVCGSYWLVPLLAGQGKTANVVASFSEADAEAFAAAGDNAFLRLAHALRLQGFWAEQRGLFLLPQERTVLFGLTMIAFIGLAITGAVALWGRRKALVLWFGISALIGLAATIISIPGAELIGLREPHKLIMLLALAYGVFLSFGVNALLARTRKKGETLYVITVVVLLALPFLTMRVMLFGFDGQLSPRQYPAGWFAAKELLAQSEAGQAIFLPWHQYQSYTFAGRIIANPAPAFFGQRVLVNQDPELGGASGGRTDDRIARIDALLAERVNLADELAEEDVRFILLAKDYTSNQYAYLDSTPDIELIADNDSMKLYVNKQWRQL